MGLLYHPLAGMREIDVAVLSWERGDNEKFPRSGSHNSWRLSLLLCQKWNPVSRQFKGDSFGVTFLLCDLRNIDNTKISKTVASHMHLSCDMKESSTSGRGVGSIFRLRGHQKCKPQIESRSRNLITKWKYKLEDIFKLNPPPPLLKLKICFGHIFCKKTHKVLSVKAWILQYEKRLNNMDS